MKKSILLLLTTWIFVGCNAQNHKNIETLDVAEFEKQLLNTPQPQLIDVRTPQEYQPQHILNAVNYNVNDAQFITNLEKLDKNKTIFVYCLSGGRSRQAANKLSEMGFSKIVDLKGGILKWNAQHETKSTEPEKIVGICPQEFNDIVKANKKTIVNFYAEWCAPCKKMKPYLMKIEQELKNSETKIVRYNADENKTIMKTLKIDELPAILIYENNKLIYSHTGFLSEDDLRKQIQQ